MPYAKPMPLPVRQSDTESGSQRTTVAEAVEQLRGWFDVEFSIFSSSSADPLHRSADAPIPDDPLLAELARTVATHRDPELLGEDDPLLVLALPIAMDSDQQATAVAAFVTRHVDPAEDVSVAAKSLGRSPSETVRWINKQTVWTPDALLRLAKAVAAKLAGDVCIARLKDEVDKVANNLASTYEEISLLYGLTQNLRISSSDEELGRLALDWLVEVIPAESVAIHYPCPDDSLQEARTKPKWLSIGECPIDAERFAVLVESIQDGTQRGPRVANQNVTGDSQWQFPEIRELILVTLAEGENVFGHLAAFNHTEEGEFGTVEASLLSSVGAILGIHSGNVELYRQQAGMLTGVVQALTSAIDAKDPYTCGHSDRVARVAVRLAQELECDPDLIRTIYMAGLLHDIGKIGVDDSVLRKPGRLTDEEFEHIKRHPELGHKILKDMKNLSDVLAPVLHHHEQWDGGGYPEGLRGEEAPLSARIVSVADAFDAMTSDRPYRRGMPDEKVDTIFRAGASTQWDPQVVEAFFQARDDLREICRNERAKLDLNVQQWT